MHSCSTSLHAHQPSSTPHKHIRSSSWRQPGKVHPSRWFWHSTATWRSCWCPRQPCRQPVELSDAFHPESNHPARSHPFHIASSHTEKFLCCYLVIRQARNTIVSHSKLCAALRHCHAKVPLTFSPDVERQVALFSAIIRCCMSKWRLLKQCPRSRGIVQSKAIISYSVCFLVVLRN